MAIEQWSVIDQQQARDRQKESEVKQQEQAQQQARGQVVESQTRKPSGFDLDR